MELLKNITWQSGILYLVFFWSIVGAIILIINRAKKAHLLFKGNKEGIAVKFGGEHNCFPDRIRIEKIIKKITALEKEKTLIKHVYLLRDQMNTAEDIYNSITYKMENILISFLKEKYPEIKDIIASPVYKNYSGALELSKRAVLAEVSKMVKENQFIDKEQAGVWDIYKKVNFDTLSQLMTKETNIYYFQEIPTLNEIYENEDSVETLKKHDYDVFKIVCECFDALLNISKSHYNKIKAIEQEKQKEIESLFVKSGE